MFVEHHNKQYSLIAEGDFSNVLVKRPRYKVTPTYYGTKQEAKERNEFQNGSDNFFFLKGRECPISNGFITENDKEVRLEIKTGPLTKKQWEELKDYVDSLYK